MGSEPIFIAELVNAALNIIGRAVDVLLLFALHRLWKESKALVAVRLALESRYGDGP
jgi:hypothetical protein